MEHSYVFISYAHKDSDKVLPCIDAMKQSGIRLWFDEGIEAGSEWPEFIAEKVLQCTKFILFVSDAYLDSQNCKRELNYAITQKKDILSIYLGSVSLSPGMEMQLGTYQAIYRDRFDSPELFHASLCREHYFNACRSDSAAHTPDPLSQPSSAQSASATPDLAPASQSGQPPQPEPSSQINDPFALFSTGVPYKNRIIAILLCLFLGVLGIQKFYLGQPKRGILYLLFAFTWVPLILSLIEGIYILVSSRDTLRAKYGYEFTP